MTETGRSRTADPLCGEGYVSLTCRLCGAYLVTHLRSDIDSWLTRHAHALSDVNQS